MKGNFRRATLAEYIEWLSGFIAKGGKPNHYCPYAYDGLPFLYVSGVFALEGEAGARSRTIIVAQNGKLHPRSGPLGDNILLYMDGFTHKDGTGTGIISVFADKAFLGLPGVSSFVEEALDYHRGRSRKRPHIR